MRTQNLGGATDRLAAISGRRELERSRWLLYASGVVLSLAAAVPARANFCDSPADAVGFREADALRLELFTRTPAGESVDFEGDRSYDARLITCNRRRDTEGNELDDRSNELLEFAEDLDARTIKGHYGYGGLAPISNLRYAYDLRREGGQWLVTVPIQFHWPDVRMTDRIDIPADLATTLGLTARGELCEPGRTILVPNSPREIAWGYIYDDIDPAQVATFMSDQRDAGIPADQLYRSRWAAWGTADQSTIENIIETYDVHASGEASCRVPRSLQRDGMSVLNHLRVYWEAAIREIWNRDGFEIVPRFVNCDAVAGTATVCDGVTNEELSAWEKDETIWHIHFNLTPGHRTSYKRWLFKWNNMHTGVLDDVIAHELGHQLGLDDEYGESPSSALHCENVSPAGSQYLMCDEDSRRNGAKGVYAWLITRRYLIGRDYQCKDEADCEEGQFCAQNGLNRNVCELRRPEGEPCSRQQQCEVELTCHFNPFGMCVAPDSVGLGGRCERDVQCISGACNTSGRCQCNDDDDCSGNRFCEEGALGIGQNECRNFHDEGESCSREGQCEPAAMCHFNPLGMCVTPDSVGLGGRCDRDVQCTTGACNTSGICQCRQDSDCDDGYCAEGVLGIGQNACEDWKREGESCSEEGHCRPEDTCHFNPFGMCVSPGSVGIGGSCERDVQCTTDACNTSGVCQCRQDSDCDDGYCAEGVFGIGQNACEDWKDEGDSCSTQEQCRPAATCHFNPFGMCVTPGSVGIGGSCDRDIQCDSGTCGSGRCVCNDDSDCPGSQECRKPIIGTNHCE